MIGSCVICQGTTFAHVTSEDRRCVECGHERWSPARPDSLRRLLRAHGFAPRAAVLSWPYNVFGYTQALLNLLMPGHNYPYYRLKRGQPSCSGLLDALGLLLLPVVVPFAIVFALADVIFPEKQGVLTYAFEKRP